MSEALLEAIQEGVAQQKKSSPKSSPKTGDKILAMVARNAEITAERMGEGLGISKRAVIKQIAALRGSGRLLRIGPAKGGHWQVVK